MPHCLAFNYLGADIEKQSVSKVIRPGAIMIMCHWGPQKMMFLGTKQYTLTTGVNVCGAIIVMMTDITWFILTNADTMQGGRPPTLKHIQPT